MLTNPPRAAKTKILAVASAGGHWVQLQRMRPAFDGADVFYLSTLASLQPQVTPQSFKSIHDASLREPFGLLVCMLQILRVVVFFRPDAVVSTGAAPGFLAIVAGKIFRAKTIWIDSIANSEELSMAGRQARNWADHWLTQWPELSTPQGPSYIGSIL